MRRLRYTTLISSRIVSPSSGKTPAGPCLCSNPARAPACLRACLPSCLPAQSCLSHATTPAVCCRETAVLLDQVGNPEAAIEYATGALVNAQVRRAADPSC